VSVPVRRRSRYNAGVHNEYVDIGVQGSSYFWLKHELPNL